jgi:putative phosphoribosyl transferase
MKFLNRLEAANKLLPLLEKYRKSNGVVMAIPRGGVPLGYMIAGFLHFPLELLMTQKISYPCNPELSIGSVCFDSRILDPKKVLNADYVNLETVQIRKGLHDRYDILTFDQEHTSIRDKTIILVDDGIASGYTMLAAIQQVRNQHPARIVVVVPVATNEKALFLGNQIDDFICLHKPKELDSLSSFYHDFSEVTDEEVGFWLQELRKNYSYK